ncbi:SAM-dependent methyltransferase [Actinomadura sp. NPDC000929]|uniref:SAM-dependent methyltransferase n=1 Tax=unclassified Actinomadura TaxID=2626254 RepID=UPI0033920602
MQNAAAMRTVSCTSTSVAPSARQDRAFLGRAVRFLASQGIRQYLDLGTGLPTVDNTHEVAQRAAPESRIGYVDNGPLVLTHARALLTSTPGRGSATTSRPTSATPAPSWPAPPPPWTSTSRSR